MSYTEVGQKVRVERTVSVAMGLGTVMVVVTVLPGRGTTVVTVTVLDTVLLPS